MNARDNINRRQFLKASLLTGAAFASGCAWLGKHESSTVAKPNIVLIVADDLGYSDLGCYGGEIQTPNIDRLAKEGLRFSQFYNGTRCCPSRASLLTGLYAHQAGVGHMTSDRGRPGYRGNLSQNSVTIAEALKSGGYKTMMAGKWHLTSHWKDNSNKDSWPCQRGFDGFYGTLPGHGSLWDPAGLVEQNEFVRAEGDYYYTEAISEKCSQWIKRSAGTDEPFFMYVAYTAPHYPLHARQEYIDKYKDTFKVGWDRLRKRRYEKLLAMGLIDKSCELSPRDEQCPPWEDEEYQDWQAHRMAVYAAMVEQMDVGVGVIVDTLRRTGQLDNTLLMFVSDNGASPEGHLNNTVERLEVPWSSSLIPQKTRDGREVVAGDWPNQLIGDDTTYGSYGVKWANVSNAPFRNHKSWVHEGGIATPMIVHWPNSKLDKGSITKQPAHIVDIMTTCLDAAKVNYPGRYNGNDIIAAEGTSLLGVFEGEEIIGRTICWEHEGNRAIRKGKWKLVSEYPGSWASVREYKNKGKWELYDIERDRTEMHDLAMTHTDKVKELSAQWQQWADRCNVIDWGELNPEAKIKID